MTYRVSYADVDPPRPIVLLRWQCGELVASKFETSAVRPDGVAVAIEQLRLDRMAWVIPENVDAVKAGMSNA